MKTHSRWARPTFRGRAPSPRGRRRLGPTAIAPVQLIPAALAAFTRVVGTGDRCLLSASNAFAVAAKRDAWVDNESSSGPKMEVLCFPH